MKIFITGVNGQLGYDVANECLLRGYKVFGCGRSEQCDIKSIEYHQLDICNAYQVTTLLYKIKPQIIIHCAAYTAVDKAEQEKILAYQINAGATNNLAKTAEMINARMVYISTDYVFDGSGNIPWKPEDDGNPLNVYGISKYLGENYVRINVTRPYIIRTQWLYGSHGNNFVKTMFNLATKQDTINVVCDQYGIPTYTYDLAKYICDLMVTDQYGTHHVTNSGKFTTWYEFCLEAFYRNPTLNPKIIPIPTAEYICVAKRPLNGRLDTSANMYSLPGWKDALRRYLWETGQS